MFEYADPGRIFWIVESDATWQSVADQLHVPLAWLLAANGQGADAASALLKTGARIEFIPTPANIALAPANVNRLATATDTVLSVFHLPPRNQSLPPWLANDYKKWQGMRVSQYKDDAPLYAPGANPDQSHVVMDVFDARSFVTKPVIHHDHGFLDDGAGNLDLSKKRSPTADDLKSFAKWIAELPVAKITLPNLKDATDAYEHMIFGMGSDYFFDYNRYVTEDNAGRTTLDSVISDTVAYALFAQQNRFKYPDRYWMESKGPVGCGGDSTRFPYPGTENWQKALGGHVIWFWARVDVTADADGTRHFDIRVNVFAEDRYNFNPGNEDITTGTADQVNGKFEQAGLVHEFMQYGQVSRHVTFSMPALQSPPAPPDLAIFQRPADIVIENDTSYNPSKFQPGDEGPPAPTGPPPMSNAPDGGAGDGVGSGRSGPYG